MGRLKVLAFKSIRPASEQFSAKELKNG